MKLIDDKKFQKFIAGRNLETEVEFQLAKAAFEHLHREQPEYKYNHAIMRIERDAKR